MPSEPVALSAVAARVGGELRGDGSVAVVDVVHDSRSVRRGSLFAALPGAKVDGHAYAGEAVGRGAAAALVERFLPISLPQVRAPDTRRALGPAAALVHGDPSLGMEVIGVTGTNGKTTVTRMIEAIAAAAGRPFGRVGTLGVSIGGRPRSLDLTTPEGSDLQRLLAVMVAQSVSLVAMEVSSHALAQERVGGTSFAVAAFTNLSRDHLDFHGDMDRYFAAKRRLFDGRAALHVFDVDGPYGRRLADSSARPAVRVGFGYEHDVSILGVETGLTASRFTCLMDGREASMTVRPGGLHNVQNAAVAIACARGVGIGLDASVRGLEALERVVGRLDPVEAGQPFRVLVDYAHTPDAVGRVVRTALHHCRGSVIVVVGAAGERDASKRPQIGAAAARAHLAVITSDNPRSEDPGRLVDQVAAGCAGGRAAVIREVDRSAAIRLAVEQARPGDTVLILGKGHERRQDLGHVVIPFDDREVAAGHLRARWA